MAVVIGDAAVAVRADPPSASDVEDSAGGPILDALSNVGGKGAALLGGLLGGAALASAFGGALEKAALGDKLSAQLGVSGQYAEDLGSIAGELYADAYGESLGEVNDALRSVVQSGAVMEDASNEQLQSVTASALDLANAFEQDVAGTANAAGRMVQTGLADSAEEALDILTRGFQQGADRGGDLLDVISEYGTTFDELGLDGAASVGLLNQALAAGIPNADFAADAIREMGIIAREGGEEAAEALGNLGLSADDYFAAMQEGGPAASAALDSVLDALRTTEDPALRAAAATALVGTQYEDLGDAILSMDPSEAAARLGEVEGAADRMGDTLNDNAQTNIESFMRQLQGGFVDLLGGQVLPIVSDVASTLAEEFGPAVEAVAGFVMDEVVPALQSFGTWLDDNSTTIGIVAGLIAALFIPHLVALAAQYTRTKVQAVIAWTVQKAQAIAAAAVHSAQITLMIARWIALGAVAVVQAAITAGAWAAGIVAAAVSGAASFAVQVARVVGGWVLMGAQSLAQAARMAAAWVLAMGPVGWVIAAVIGLVALIIANWETVKTFTVNAFRAVVDFVVGAFRGVVSSVSGAISSVVSFVSGLPGKIVRGLGNLGGLLVSKGRELIQGLVDGIAGAARFVGNVARNVVNSIIGFINRNVIDGINGLLEFSIAGITINPPDIPRIPRLHSGGVFDSGTGEGLALLSDGERVITPEQRIIADRLLADLLGGSLSASPTRAAAGQAPVEIHEHIYQQPGESPGTLAARTSAAVVWNLNNRIGRRVGVEALEPALS